MGILLLSPFAGLIYVAHVLYWFWRVKLEYFNHALAGVLIVLSGFLFQGEFLQERRCDLIAVFLAYLMTGYIQTYFKNACPRSIPFWRLRLRIYLISIRYALYRKSWDPILTTGCGMVGCEWLTWIFRNYREDRRKKIKAVVK